MNVTPQPRRRHSAEFKEQVVAACALPGATVAAVARAFSLNDNLVHDWRRGRSGAGPANGPGTALLESQPEFVALSMPAAPVAAQVSPVAAASGAEIRLEFKRGAIAVSVTWPVAAAADCAVWLREVLR